MTTETTDVKAKMQEAVEILAKAQRDVAPLLSELKPYLDGAKAAAQIDPTNALTADDIIEACFGNVRFELPAEKIIPSVLAAGAPAQIREAGEQLMATYRTLGTMIGNVAGIVAGMAV